MSASLTPLRETLARLDAHLAEQGLDRGEVLDVGELSRRTALAEGEVRALLDAEELREPGEVGHVRHLVAVELTLALRGRRLTPRRQEALTLMLEGLPISESEEAER
ncbi:hypothetical protein [Streptomyces olivochromogenes]|uniref:Uncharacterized protein n=1 Tax=Streptomyces olivochromogenes TaxID=1963 RepID=A0A250V731_STROL|nr:hypothetical protein [Streptomyces olivochromogenes]KUN45985.1 hypothetical protein AQJ27_18195 [Streptomyces olivochromogenes]GAX49978.1 hypothetical protein SO3561_01468 [Streptomyces olivochromogenes]